MARDPLTQIVGRLTRDPQTKSTSKGDVVEVGIAQSDGFGDDAKVTFFDGSVWNEGLQASIASAGLKKGSTVVVNGVVTQDGQYNPKIKNVIQLGTVTWLDRSKAQAQPVDQDDF